MLGNILLMLLGLLGVFCGVWHLTAEPVLFVGRAWDAVTGAAVLGNAVVFGVNLYEFVCVDD